MKKIMLLLTLGMSFTGMAQVLKVSSVEKIDAPQTAPTAVVGMSPQGDYVLLSSPTNQGLVKLDLNSKETTTLSTAPGAGFDVRISQDGTNVVYREVSFATNKMKKVALKNRNMITQEVITLADATRDLQGYSIDGTTASVVKKGKQSARALGKEKVQTKNPVLSIKDRQLMISYGGKSRIFSPNGQNFSYIWPSLSPNGQKVLYYVSGVGAFVCDLNGKNIQALGQVRAPKWYDDATVVGMNDKDDGQFIYASSIVVVALDGSRQTLTDDSVIAMYPHPSLSGDKISFSTPKGEAYIIHITK